jgi:hypothetical protein
VDHKITWSRPWNGICSVSGAFCLFFNKKNIASWVDILKMAYLTEPVVRSVTGGFCVEEDEHAGLYSHSIS